MVIVKGGIIELTPLWVAWMPISTVKQISNICLTSISVSFLTSSSDSLKSLMYSCPALV